MDILSAFIPRDRRAALARGVALPDRAWGTALFADISGFTTLTTTWAAALGPERGAEQITQMLNQVFEALIAAVHAQQGSVIGFSGDAITCWFDDDAGARAAWAARAMQAAMVPFRAPARPGGAPGGLALKVAVAQGPVRRFLVGDPAIQVMDALAGATLDRLAATERLAAPGEILLDAAAAAAIAAAGPQGAWRATPDGLARVFVLTGWAIPRPREAGDPPSAEGPDVGRQAQQWVLPAVGARLAQGHGEFLAELRPAVALFLRFGGIDYDADRAAGTRLDIFIRGVQRVLARYDGALLQLTIGDKGSYLYAAFGAPLAHSDDAARAAAAALELRAPPPTGPTLPAIQIGLSSGLVWSGAYGGPDSRTYGVLGDSVNLAARLMQHAAPGGILATAAVRQAAGPRFQWADLPPVRVKGRLDPVEVAGLMGEQARPGRDLLEPIYQGPLMGRAAELAMLDDRRAAAQAGQGQVVGIIGEAGLGKSRLLAEAVRRARAAGWLAYGGAAQAYGTASPYLTWQTVWRALFGLDERRPLAAQITALAEALAASDPRLQERLPLLGPVVGLAIPDTPLTAALDPGLRKTSLYALLVDSLRALAQARPRVLVLEDCQWLDPLSHDLLEALGRAIRNMPVLLLLAYRPPEIERLQAPRVEGLPHFTAIRPPHLAPADAAALVAWRLAPSGGAAPARALPSALVETLVERAGGNPFYLEELLAYLAARGIDPDDTAALGALDWPASLHSLLLARIDQLTEPQRTVLKVASIIGRRFAVAELWGVHADLPGPEVVRPALAVLDQVGLTPLDVEEPEPIYLFKHMVTQEVAYASLPPTLRARLHGQFAAWLEQGRPAVPAVGQQALLALLAYHYSRSGNQAKQREYLRRAGDAAAAGYAYAVAEDYYTRLLTLEPAEAQAEVRLALAAAQEQTGAWASAGEHYRHVLAGAIPAPLEAQAALGLGGIYYHQDEYAQAETWLKRARTLFAGQGAQDGVIEALAALGRLYGVQGEYPQAREVLEEALALARASGAPAGLARVAGNLGRILWRQGTYEAARTLCEESLALCRARDDKPGMADALNNLAGLALDQGDLATARTRWEECLLRRREAGDKNGIAGALGNLGVLAYNQGDLATARALWEECLVLFQDLGARMFLGVVIGNLGLVAHAQGDYVTARRLYAESLGLRQAVGNKPGAAMCVLNLGQVAVDQADYTAATAFFAEGLALCRDLGDRRLAVEGLVGRAALAALGEAPTEGPWRAGVLLGACAHLLADLDAALEPMEQRRAARTEAAAREALGAPAFAAAWAVGQALSWEEALTFALPSVSGPPAA